MGALDRLPTLAEVQADRASRPNWKSVTRLADKTAAKKLDAKELDAWRRAVSARDRGRCRVCGIRTLATLELVPNRREIHHVVSRTNPLIRYDVRNGLTVCKTHHDQLTRHQLFVIGTAADLFVAGRTGKKYLNTDRPLKFASRR
jgi:predicted restriction endonuclease